MIGFVVCGLLFLTVFGCLILLLQSFFDLCLSVLV